MIIFSTIYEIILNQKEFFCMGVEITTRVIMSFLFIACAFVPMSIVFFLISFLVYCLFLLCDKLDKIIKRKKGK